MISKNLIKIGKTSETNWVNYGVSEKDVYYDIYEKYL